MSANVHILTNSPLAAEKYPDLAALLEANVEGVFKAARDEIHLGAVLINHPLAGSIKPNESPYKSLLLSTQRGAVDFKSLEMIEAALYTLKKMPVRDRALPDKVLEDFQVIDLDLLDSAFKALPALYHL
ncbi:MAG: GrdX family protein [Oscillospiraceae bacterium]|nr:GrdX family protein [Oscillospiraceae bacterium]